MDKPGQCSGECKCLEGVLAAGELSPVLSSDIVRNRLSQMEMFRDV